MCICSRVEGAYTESIVYMKGEREREGERERGRERDRLNDRASIGRGVPSNILRYTGRLSIHYQLSAFVARRYLDDIRQLRLLQTGRSRNAYSDAFFATSFPVNVIVRLRTIRINKIERKTNDL